MSKQHPKTSDKVPHPDFPEIQVTRRFAREWLKSKARIEEWRRKGKKPLVTLLHGTPNWERHLEEVAQERGTNATDLLSSFRDLDALIESGQMKDSTLKPWRQDFTVECQYRKDDGSTKTVQRYDGDHELEEEADSEYVRMLVKYVVAQLEDFQTGRYAAREAERKALRVQIWEDLDAQAAAGNFDGPSRGRPRSSTSKDALRKRKARAEGRVKPKPKKGSPSIEQRIAATEKSLVTRRQKLAKLRAGRGESPVVSGEILRCEEGIRRQEKALETYKARQAAQNS